MPAYFYNDETLLKKYAEARYNENILLYNMVTGANIPEFKEIRRPVPGYAGKLLPEWEQFLKTKEMPYPFYQIGQSHSLGFMPQLRRGFSEYVYKRFNGNLEDYNSACNSNITAWYYANIPLERFYEKSYLGEDSYAYRLFKDFKGKQDKRHRIYLSMENMYRYGYLALKYGSLVEDYNIAHGTNYGSYSDIMLSETVPQKPGMERADWLDFVRNNLNRAFIEVAPQSITAYHSMLKDKYDDDIARLNHSYRKSYAGFDQVPLTADRYTAGTPMVDYDQFVMTAAPEGLRITGPDILFRHYLAGKYGSIAVLNRELHTGYRSFARIGMPAWEYDYITMMRYKRDIKTEFITRNYKMVLNYILLHGRGVFNTLVFCLFSIAISLTVNPVSAYALSRYDLPSTFKILLFMMATMAFPAAVTMIPNFLLLKEMHLLNTFWALILPGLANGYSIFLLKGFFDSLPRELYEAGMIDGANEWTLFWKVTMSLSKPILAVIALGAFTASYGAFMYAFTVCQNENMWTLMVWLFKLQQNTHMAVTFAALILAAVPTLIVFILSQNVIMRGIIVPQEK